MFSGIVLGLFILHDFSIALSIRAIFELFISLLSEPWILKTLGFAILVGSIMALIEQSGGIEGFVEFMQKRLGLVKSARSALMLSYVIGLAIFIESSITSLIAGAVGRGFVKEYKIPAAKLAFVCDSTAAPVSSLIILNGWGALLLGLIATQIQSGVIEGDAITILLESIAFNFYAMVALIVTFVAIWFNIDIGAMKHAKYINTQTTQDEQIEKKAQSMYFMVLPMLVMVALVFVYLYISGDGNLLKGSGSSAIFYTVLTTLIFMFFYYILKRNMTYKTWSISAFKGAVKLFPIAIILLFSFAIGEVTSELKTGEYLASLAQESLNVYLLASVVFILSSLISFSTGTSWGTFSIMIPIAVPMAVVLDANIALVLGAAISGGIFGDHSSPISDTTIISSMASDCDVVEHVNTQLPYTLISAAIALLLFFLASALFS
ncbi:MAG: Na+/H+ antiporter NhaC family protein [Sulfurimonas sp.]|nr:Na+/H+ antiporter NhaC family protein [Sulfurimonas sp.]